MAWVASDSESRRLALALTHAAAARAATRADDFWTLTSPRSCTRLASALPSLEVQRSATRRRDHHSLVALAKQSRNNDALPFTMLVRSAARSVRRFATAASFDVLMFPGQGAQVAGMGRDLADNFAASREVFEEVDEALQEKLSSLMFTGSPVSGLMLRGWQPSTGALISVRQFRCAVLLQADLSLTRNTQPALLAHSIAAYRVLKVRGPWLLLALRG